MKNSNTLTIIIDGKSHTIHQQYLTGREIKELGKIPLEHELYLKIKEPWQNELINDDTNVDLARPSIEHFFSKVKDRELTLIINGEAKKWDHPKISFKEVVLLAFGTYNDSETMVYTVAYEDGPKENREGSMSKKSEVVVKNKMIFHATATDKS